MREAEVVAAFCDALRADGWGVRTEVDFIDVVAERDGQTIYAEAKGTTTSPGLDVDTMYGRCCDVCLPTRSRRDDSRSWSQSTCSRLSCASLRRCALD